MSLITKGKTAASLGLRAAFAAALAFGGSLTAHPDTSSAEAPPANLVTDTLVADTGGFVIATAFAPDGRLFYTTKPDLLSQTTATGSVRIVENGVLRPTPFLSTTVDDVGERGLLGLAIDPHFATNHYVYVLKMAPPAETGTALSSHRVVRYTEDPATETAVPGSALVILDLPVQEFDVGGSHHAGNIHIGPDGKMYASIGDNGWAPYAQDLTKAWGKIHRINTDGTIPADNPFIGTPGAIQSIYMIGLRNAFDFTFDPVSGNMFVTQNGPKCNDSIVLGKSGGDYGWTGPESDAVTCGYTFTGTTETPLLVYPKTIGITGITVYQGPIPGWDNELFWCQTNKPRNLHHGRLNAARNAILSDDIVELATPICRVDLVSGPDGAFYTTIDSQIFRTHLNDSYGGRSFGVSIGNNGASMSWAGGSLQPGYLVYRIGLPSNLGSLLGPILTPATNYIDTSTLTESFYCYVLFTLDAHGMLAAISDIECVMPHTATGPNPAADFTLRMDQSSTARLTWTAPGGQDDFTVFAVPMDGSPATAIALGKGTTTTTHNTGGKITCYSLVSRTGLTYSSSNVVCAIPGGSFFPVTAAKTLGDAQTEIGSLLSGVSAPDITALMAQTMETLAG